MFWCFTIFYNSHPVGYEVVSYCSFDLLFLGDQWCWASFHVLIAYLHLFFGEMSIKVLCPLVNWVAWVLFLSFPYIQDINPYQVWSKHFLPSVGCLFTLSIVSFNTQFLNFYPNYLFFPFVVFGAITKKWFSSPLLWKVCSIFSSRNFILIALIFRYLIHCELIFVDGVRLGSSFIFYMWGSSFPRAFIEKSPSRLDLGT